MKPILELDKITGHEISKALESLYTTVDLAIYSSELLAQEICRRIQSNRAEQGEYYNEQP